MFDAFKKEAEKKGIDVLKEVTYPADQLHGRDHQVKEAASVNPDVIVDTGYFPDSLLVAKAVQALKPDIQALYGIANGAFDDDSFPAAAGSAGTDVLERELPLRRHQQQGDRHPQALRAEVRQADGDRVGAVLPGGRGDRAGARGRQEHRPRRSSRRHRRRVEIDDPLLAFDGPITFDSTGQNENATVIVMQIQKGKVEQVFPDRSRPPSSSSPPGQVTRDDDMTHSTSQASVDAADADARAFSAADARLPTLVIGAVLLAIVLVYTVGGKDPDWSPRPS